MLSQLFALVAWTLLLLAATPGSALPRRSRDLRRAGRPSPVRRQEGAGACETLFELNDVQVFNAADVAACTATIPFNSSVASQFLQYYRDTLAFQSTLAYLKNPPKSYQQPPADILSDLDIVQRAVDANAFTNENDFETAVLRVVQSAHDAHLQLSIGVSSIFGFGSEYAISSVSTDGVEVPRPYLMNDLLDAQASGTKASPIVEINGQDAVEWLTQFAATNSQGLIDPNADWNALMQTPAGDIQFIPPVFNGGTPFNPGDRLDFKLENGKVVQSSWRALIDIPILTPALTTGEEVYNFFVLGQLPQNSDDLLSNDGNPPASADAPPPADEFDPTADEFDPTADESDPAAGSDEPAPRNWFEAAQVQAYPNDTFIVQPDLGTGGVLTGYFLADSDVAVLSIPSFEMFDTAVSSFSETIGQFLEKSKSAGKKKIVLDVQQNYGGNALLAVDAFKQFFPGIDPFTGSRMRSFDVSNALGLTFTQFWSTNKDTLNQSWIAELTDLPWAVLDYTDAETGQAFTSWPEFFGPHSSNDDLFSTLQRDNLSNIQFDEFATGGADSETLQPLGIAIYGYGNRSNVSPQPYAASDILILTDGICQSSCATFVEMMHHEAGVRTVAVGGRPNIGPMQAVGGSRGALLYETGSLDGDMQLGSTLNDSIKSILPASHLNEVALSIAGATINLRDQVRKGEDVPLQFAYEAADCRIYWTLDTFNNFTALWAYAADAVWGDGKKCVKESTNFDSSNKTNTNGPDQKQIQSWGGYGSPSRTPILPAGFNAPDRVLVGEGSDGKLIVTAVPTPAVALLKEVPLDNSTTSGLDVDLGAELNVNRLKDPYSLRLNKGCTTTEQCDILADEVCLPTFVCKAGEFFTIRVCKRKCTEPADCASSLRPRAFCNTLDFTCGNRPGQPKCIRETETEFRGSGLMKSTFGRRKPTSAPVGFCEPRQPVDFACRQFQNLNPQTFTPQSGFTEVIDVPANPAAFPAVKVRP